MTTPTIFAVNQLWKFCSEYNSIPVEYIAKIIIKPYVNINGKVVRSIKNAGCRPVGCEVYFSEINSKLTFVSGKVCEKCYTDNPDEEMDCLQYVCPKCFVNYKNCF